MTPLGQTLLFGAVTFVVGVCVGLSIATFVRAWIEHRVTEREIDRSNADLKARIAGGCRQRIVPPPCGSGTAPPRNPKVAWEKGRFLVLPKGWSCDTFPPPKEV